LEKEHVFELLVTIASLAEGSEFGLWNMVALDIFHLVFRGVKPNELIKSIEEVRRRLFFIHRVAVDETVVLQTRANKLADMLAAEKKHKTLDMRKSATRHSRFGTTVSLTTVCFHSL
jgi:replication fork protection complex subunit Tof1/Swi1